MRLRYAPITLGMLFSAITLSQAVVNAVGIPYERGRQRYEAVRSSKHGLAVGRLEGDMCGACRVNLPAGHLERLSSGPDIGVCPMCQRILIVRSPK